MAITKKISGLIFKSDTQMRAEAHREAMRIAAKLGGKVFGPIPQGVRREFFCLDAHTWVWHEEWDDASRIHHIRTTRYDIRPHGVFKAQDGQPYQPISRDEARNLLGAMKRYQEILHTELEPRIAVQ